MYFWIAVGVLVAGIITSYSVHGKRVFPTIISVLAIANLFASQKYAIGPISMTIMALLAVIVLGWK
ncbi:hypothetical protein [Pseudoalteromonas sp. T1lg48]|uniref:hypothetical protein n=1 Tax=Pseudoalteromonas sp. T1lg48 TaxID=2077100 RepID=UPI000CF6292E|nr:hypothetical protein [Pseudoalteromonas sp. T1lg48]